MCLKRIFSLLLIVSATAVLTGCGNSNIFDERKYLDLKNYSSRGNNSESKYLLVNSNQSISRPFFPEDTTLCDTIALKDGRLLLVKILEETPDKIIYRNCCSRSDSVKERQTLSDCDTNARYSKKWSDIDFIARDISSGNSAEVEREEMIATGRQWLFWGVVIFTIGLFATLFFWFIINSITFWTTDAIQFFTGVTIAADAVVLIISLFLIIAGIDKINKGKRSKIKRN